MGTRRLEVLLVGKDVSGTAVLDKLGNKSKEVEGKTSSLGKVATGALLAAGAAMVKFGTTAVSEYQRIGTETLKLQRYMGGTPEEMSRLRFALQQSGVETDTFTKSMNRASKSLVDAKDPMRDYGVATRQANGEMRPSVDIMLDVADKLKSMPAGYERVAYAQKVFGKSGAELIPFLSKGSEGIDELMAKTDEYGLTLTGDNLQAIKDNKAAQRELTAAMDGLQVKIGSAVLPILTSATDVLAGIPGPVMAIVAPMAAVSGVAIGLAVTYQKLSGVIGPVVSGLGSMGKAAKTSFDAMSNGQRVISGMSFAAAAGGVYLLTQRLNDNADAAKDWASQFAGSGTIPQQLESTKKAIEDLRGEAESFASVDAFGQHFFGSNEGREKADQLNALVEQEKQLQSQIDAANNSADLQAQGLDEMGNALGDVTTEADKTADAYADATKKMTEFWNPTFDLDSTAIAATQAHADLSEALTKNGGALDMATQAGRDNRSEFREGAQAAIAYGQEIIRNGGTLEEATTATNNHIAGLRDQMVQAGASKTSVDLLITALHLTPSEVNTQFDSPGLAETLQRAESLKRSIEWLSTPRGGPVAPTRDPDRGAGPTRRAAGGMLHDGMFMVGEAGPEIGYKSGSNVSIVPNSRASSMLQPAPGGMTVNIYPQGHVLTTEDLANELESVWRQKARSGTGILADV